MWTWESIRPGIAVMPPASATTSAASTAAAEAVPTDTIFPPSVRMVSPATNGLCQSPDTISPRLVMAIFIFSALAVDDGLEPLRRHRKLRDRARNADRVVDRGGDRGTDGIDAALARTLDAER